MAKRQNPATETDQPVVETEEQTAARLKQQGKGAPNAAYAGSVPYLMLAGNLVAGWQLARALLVAEELLPKGQDEGFLRAKIVTARFYAEHILPRTQALRDAIVEGAQSVTALAVEDF